MASLRDLFKGSVYDNITSNSETLVKEELNGIRTRSLADANNPLLYGSDTTRIALRTTPTLDVMKTAATGKVGNSGILGKAITTVRNKVNETLGIPHPLIQTGGGNLKTIGHQLLGNTIKLGKDKLRNALFGNTVSSGITTPKPLNFFEYSNTNTYTDVKKKLNYKEQVGNKTKFRKEILETFQHIKPIDLAKYSPIYGVDRHSELWTTELGHQIRKEKFGDNTSLGSELTSYSIDTPYTGNTGDKLDNKITKDSLEIKYGIAAPQLAGSTQPKGTHDIINLQDVNTTNTVNYSTEKYEKYDLVPFWIGRQDDTKTPKTHFRTLLNGITETVSPNWSSNSFFGNPYEFYTYSGVGRELTFSLQIYCMNSQELINNWQKITKLTEYTYPKFKTIKDRGTLINPPIINFRLGDMYNNKVGYISSLSYTLPDNTTWEIDPSVGLLPKYIDVSVSIKFIENIGVESKGLYANPTSLTKTNMTFNESPRTGPAALTSNITKLAKLNTFSVPKTLL